MGEKDTLPFGEQWAIDQAKKAIGELETAVRNLHAKLDAETGVIQKFKPYPVDVWMGKVTMHGKTPESVITQAKEEYEKSLPVREENAAIAANNLAIRKKLEGFIENAQIPTSYVWWVKKGRSSKTESVTAEWVAGMRQAIPTNCGWGSIEQQYREFIRRQEEKARAAEAEKRKQEQAAEEEKRKLAFRAFLMVLSERYGTEVSDLSAARDLLLGQNKYLRLAYGLERNRGDWSDGPDYAERGLHGFEVVTDQDKKIVAEIQGLIDDWDGDGRVFRDCQYNYGVLYEIAKQEAPQVVSDLMRLIELSGDEFENF
jgi:hypothetical protein